LDVSPKNISALFSSSHVNDKTHKAASAEEHFGLISIHVACGTSDTVLSRRVDLVLAFGFFFFFFKRRLCKLNLKIKLNSDISVVQLQISKTCRNISRSMGTLFSLLTD